MTKKIIITGATSGIGRALTLHLASLGHSIIAIGRNQVALDELTSSLPERITTITADITKTEDRLKVKQALSPDDKGLYLVHNAGIAIPTLLKDISEKEWDQHYLINTKAPVFLTQQLIPHLKNGGRVLHISTGLAHFTLPGFSAYGVTKAAFYMLKEFCNTELLDHDIAFGSVMPGVVDTPIQDKIRNADLPVADMFKGFKERDELLSPEVVAKFLAWLLFETDKQDYVKGDWDIYDASHHKCWAKAGDIKQRQN